MNSTRPLKSALRGLLATLAILCLSLPAAAQDAAKPSSSFDIPATDDGLPGSGPIRRYDWFKNLWRDRRSAWAKQVQQDQGAIVFLGDSITQGWGADFKGKFPTLKLANRGISGDTTRGVLIRLKEDVLDLHPKAVVLLIGTNDLEEGADPATIAANLKLILAELARNDAKMPVVLCRVFPSSETKKRSAANIKKINELYSGVIKGNPQVTLVDTWTLFADAKGDAKAEEFPDLLHPNDIGYAKWTAGLKPVLATLGFLDTEPDTFKVEPGFVSLFNGKNLDGWGYRVTSEADRKSATGWQKSDPNAPPWPFYTEPVRFDGKTISDDGRYFASNGRLIVKYPVEGRKIQQIYTTKEFSKDFILRLEFRASPNADSGVFIKGQQLQCRDYPLAGPYKSLTRYVPQDWNDLEIVVKGGTARCTCNGEVLEEAFKVPAVGAIGLEGDLGQMEYRRIRIKELP